MQQKLGKALVGSWQLVSITYLDASGLLHHFWGEKPQGILTYTASGHINVQFMQQDRQSFYNPAFGSGTTEEVNQAFGSYQSYYGTYAEQEAGVLQHHIQGCLFPNWSGTTEIRYAKINGNQLTLTTPPTQVKESTISVDALWQRLD